MRHYLEFERPIADLEAKIDELSALSEGGTNLDDELKALRREDDVPRDCDAPDPALDRPSTDAPLSSNDA